MREDNYKFRWSDIGSIEIGRPNLGCNTNVIIYRLMQFTIRSLLSEKYGGEAAAKIFYDAGYLAGREFCANLLDLKLEIYPFISQLQELLKEYNVGILRVEKSDIEKLEFTFTIAEDLDCSGLPVTNETVCNWDEGFIAGIIDRYSNINFSVVEVDCWSSGGRICRFEVKPKR